MCFVTEQTATVVVGSSAAKPFSIQAEKSQHACTILRLQQNNVLSIFFSQAMGAPVRHHDNCMHLMTSVLA